MTLVSVVIDTSVFADYYLLYPTRPERHQRARTILKKISELGLPVYEPFLFEIELRAVLVRRINPRQVLEIVATVLNHVNIVEEREIHDKAAETALTTGCRAVDAYYIATARRFNAILVTNDKVMKENGLKANIEVYYLLDDNDYYMLKKRIMRSHQHTAYPTP